jgi:hypothetical protein
MNRKELLAKDIRVKTSGKHGYEVITHKGKILFRGSVQRMRHAMIEVLHALTINHEERLDAIETRLTVLESEAQPKTPVTEEDKSEPEEELPQEESERLEDLEDKDLRDLLRKDGKWERGQTREEMLAILKQ